MYASTSTAWYGCPDTEQGFKDTTYLLAPEFVPTLKHEYGTFAAGRDDNPGKVSARCQFYIVQNKKGLARLNNDYTVYGKVIKGMDIVDAIANAPKYKTDTPLKAITLDVNIMKVKAKKLNQYIQLKNPNFHWDFFIQHPKQINHTNI